MDIQNITGVVMGGLGERASEEQLRREMTTCISVVFKLPTTRIYIQFNC